MGNTTSWLTQSLCPEEQALWVAAKSGDLQTLREGLARLTPETRFYAEWRDPVYGYSPLANACFQGHLHCIQALLAAGVDPNGRDAQGNTPLHIAVANGKSEVVRLLLEAPNVDIFARTSSKAQTALDLARHHYKISEGRGLKFIQCVEHVEKKLCLYSGWLYERSDNFLSLASGISSLDSWKKRYAMVLRTAEREVVEIDLFPMRPGERRPPCPRYGRDMLLFVVGVMLKVFVDDSSELLYRASDGIQQSDDVTWLNRKEFRFSLKASRKTGSSQASAVQAIDFAATNQGELVAWKTFLTSLRVTAPASPITPAFAGSQAPRAQPAASPVRSISPNQAALLQEQRDFERAVRLSLEESRRQSRTQSAPSAPPPSDTMLETLGYSETVVGADGVEIVQLIRDDEGSAASAPSSLPADAKATTGESELQSGECVICFDGPQTAVCVPCGHNAVCMDCAQELLDTTRLCPVCRQPVREVIRLFRV